MSPMIARPLTIELALLGYLRREPLHGYQIHQRLLEPDGLGQIWRLKQAQLYALLDKLEEGGLIQGNLQVQETRPARRVYALTLKGLETYLAWLKTPVTTPRQMRQEFLAKLFFAQREGKPQAMVLVESQLAVCREWFEGHSKQLTPMPDKSFSRVVDLYRLGQIQAILDWLEQLKSEAN